MFSSRRFGLSGPFFRIDVCVQTLMMEYTFIVYSLVNYLFTGYILCISEPIVVK